MRKQQVAAEFIWNNVADGQLFRRFCPFVSLPQGHVRARTEINGDEKLLKSTHGTSLPLLRYEPCSCGDALSSGIYLVLRPITGTHPGEFTADLVNYSHACRP